MWNDGFYPTPKEVVAKVLSKYVDDDGGKFFHKKNILEPSAGKGDFLDGMNEFLAEESQKYWNKYYKGHHTYTADSIKSQLKPYICCLEIEPELAMILKEKGYTYIGSDFLNFWPDERYNLIVMNPPFANGVKHLLHAWEIVDDGGDIACILPSYALDKETKEVTLLRRIMEEHGEIVHLGPVFEDAFRKTSVDCSAYYLHKPEDESGDFAFGNFDKFDKEENNFVGEENFANEIAIRDTIGNLVTNYERCLRLFKEIQKAVVEYSHYSKGFVFQSFDNKETFTDILNSAMNTSGVEGQKAVYNKFVNYLKRSGWKKVFELTNIGNFATSRVANDFQKFCNEQENLSFCKENITQLLENLYLSRGTIRNQCIVDVFDMMTAFDEKNKVHFEGWKTNDFYKVNKRVIIPYGVDTSWLRFNDEIHINWNSADKLRDIDKCMCFLTGKKFDEVNNIMAFYNINRGTMRFGEWYDTEFFRIRFYKKGTIHLEFKDLDLLARFNQLAVKDKWNWLGGEKAD